MGLVTARITLSNPLDRSIAPVEVDAVVDTSIQNLHLPEALARQLQLRTVQMREITTANGQRLALEYVGPVDLTSRARTCCLGGLIGGDEVVLGIVPMSELDVMTPATFRPANASPALRPPR